MLTDNTSITILRTESICSDITDNSDNTLSDDSCTSDCSVMVVLGKRKMRSEPLEFETIYMLKKQKTEDFTSVYNFPISSENMIFSDILSYNIVDEMWFRGFKNVFNGKINSIFITLANKIYERLNEIKSNNIEISPITDRSLLITFLIAKIIYYFKSGYILSVYINRVKLDRIINTTMLFGKDISSYDDVRFKLRQVSMEFLKYDSIIYTLPIRGCTPNFVFHSVESALNEYPYHKRSENFIEPVVKFEKLLKNTF